MPTSLGSLTTPDDYIKYYYDLFKSELDKKELKASKVGFLGFLLNIFGFTQYDVKQYYDHLFKEMFPATSDIDDNLTLHGSIYNYFPDKAKAAVINGTFEFDFSVLPRKASDVVKREISIKNFNTAISGLAFILDATYTIINIDDSYLCQISTPDGNSYNIPFLLASPLVTIKDLIQYTSKITTFTVPTYVYGTSYSHTIVLDGSGFISDIKAYVNNVEFEIRPVKWTSSSTDEVLFARYLPGGKILIELGSGYNGKYIPDSEVRIELKVTQGLAGNITSCILTPTSGSAVIYDTIDDGSIRGPTTVALSPFMVVNVNYASTGSNPLSGEYLRSAIISHIQTRNNLVSELDYSNILSSYITDSYFVMFKKTNVIENIIYVYVPLVDKYMQPVKTISYIYSKEEFDTLSIYKPIVTIGVEQFISPFLYVYDSLTNMYDMYIVNDSSSHYFSDIQAIDPNTTDISPSLSLTIASTPSTSSVQFDLTSYQDISAYSFTMSIPAINLNEEPLSSVDDNTFSYLHTVGLVYDEMDIFIYLYDGDTKVFTYTLRNITVIYDVSDICALKVYNDGTTDYVINIPFILKSTYDSDREYYFQRIVDFYTNLNISENRMISDDTQLRFINTHLIEDTYLEPLTIQNHSFDLQLPLKFNTIIIGDRNQIITQKININDKIYEINLALAQKLLDEYTGTKIIFYKTKLMDFIHSFGSWIKTVAITITDSTDTPITITDSNIETIDQVDIIKDLTKFQSVAYCPIYFYWDLNNIAITVSLE